VQENGSSNHGEPFFLKSLSPALSEGEGERKKPPPISLKRG